MMHLALGNVHRSMTAIALQCAVDSEGLGPYLWRRERYDFTRPLAAVSRLEAVSGGILSMALREEGQLLLSGLMTISPCVVSGYWWAKVDLPGEMRDSAALRIARHIAWNRCGGAPQFFHAWLERHGGGPAHADDVRECLEAFVASESVGTPDSPASAAHLEGFVAEHIWDLLILEDALGFGKPIRVDGPDWSVTDSGGDGLAIQRSAQDLAFRLWESKAHTGSGDVRDVVNKACRQIESNALRYLARFSKVGQSVDDPDLRLFYAELPERWRNMDRAAGGGVSVATHSSTTEDCFDGFPRYWGFTCDDQRQGLVITIENFSDFSEMVRRQLWKGL